MKNNVNTEVSKTQITSLDCQTPGEHFDVVEENLRVANALLDCVSVLAALERMDRIKDTASNRHCGQGSVAGYEVDDATIPTVLLHAQNLLFEVADRANSLFEIARAGGRK